MIVTAAPKGGNGQLSNILNKHINHTPTGENAKDVNDQSIRQQSAANSLFVHPQENNAMVPYVNKGEMQEAGGVLVPLDSARKERGEDKSPKAGTMKKIQSKAANEKFKVHFEENVTTK